MSERHFLDNPIRASQLGPHAHVALRHGSVLRYPPDMAPFCALPDKPDAAAWADLAALVGPGATAAISAPHVKPPPGWEVVDEITGVQFIDTGVAAEPDPAAVVLGPSDVPEMLALVERTRPGPFGPRTIEMGTYLGIRHHGTLVAMAGERLHPPGWTEVSAVCAHEGYRGLRLATRLVLAITAGIRERRETAMPHAAASNVNAIRLYESLGFTLRRHTRFVAVRGPAEEAVA